MYANPTKVQLLQYSCILVKIVLPTSLQVWRSVCVAKLFAMMQVKYQIETE